MARKSTPAVAKVVAGIRDGLANVVSGLGMPGSDKAASNFFLTRELTDQQLVSIYRGTYIGRKLIDIPAEDMTREWRRWQATKEQIALLEAEEGRLNIQSRLTETIRWSRLYGGAALIIGDGSANPELPLEPEKMRRGGLLYVACVTRDILRAEDGLETDIASPWFGMPSMWSLHAKDGRQTRIHPSRVIPFTGAPRPPTFHVEDGWGDSVITAALDAIENAATASSVIASLLQEAKLDVVKIPDLADAVSTAEGEARMIRRFTIAKLGKSVVNTLILGSGEDFEQKTINFAGLPDIHIRFLQEAAGAADMPVTRMLGQSPAGLSSTGESDLRNWYDKIAKDQESMLRPALARLDACMMMSVFGKMDPDIYYEFPPLWQLTPEVAAEVAVKKATVFTADVNSGLIPDEALATGRVNQLIEDGVYPGLEAAIEKAKAENDERLVPELEEAPELNADLPTAPADRPGLPTAPARLRLVASRDARFKDATPRSLYVRRDVLNWEAIAEWAKAQGFPTTVGAEMHVTIMYSRGAIDWMKIDGDSYGDDENGNLRIKPGGVRLVERFGKASVLVFGSSRLSWRHESMKWIEGITWDWDEYNPHITISYEAPGDLDLRAMEPYRGEILLGPEIFEEVKEGASEGITEDGE